MSPAKKRSKPSDDELWATVEDRYQFLRRRGLDQIRAEFIAACRELIERGHSHREIAERLGVSRPSITEMLNS